ncbi:SIMPL domain-containing protein [Rhodohalobacter halophilus]|uniref:SIMPL domain-containing protein n=1 Tax=Rhodohalobacter halophilus TaxID=1812810 RepID=UPI00083FBAB9|nr:SIMPL domain-containing protein [Rhodohalobacter halophilus]
MMNRLLTITIPVILLLLSGCNSASTLTAQDAKTITIDASGEVLAPADEIIFNIVINRFDAEASVAFASHKEQERFLTQLIIDQQIDEEYINAYPINISPRRHTQNPGFETRQSVTLRLQDLDQFESMQITLIENGFDNFSANFSTSSVEEYRKKALESAIEDARDKAGLLANASGAELGQVLSIDYTSSQPVARREMALMSADSYGGSLIEMQQSIPVRENVRIRFLIQ